MSSFEFSYKLVRQQHYNLTPARQELKANLRTRQDTLR